MTLRVKFGRRSGYEESTVVGTVSAHLIFSFNTHRF